MLVIGFAPAAIPLNPCRALVAPPYDIMLFSGTDAAGFARTPIAVPGGPAFLGLRAFGQYAVVDPAGGLFGAGLSLSDALCMQVGT